MVLSRDEVVHPIAAFTNLKHQTALSIAYAMGLRTSEVVALKVGENTTVLVLGGGIIETTRTYYAALAGYHVTVVDRQRGFALATSQIPLASRWLESRRLSRRQSGLGQAATARSMPCARPSPDC